MGVLFYGCSVLRALCFTGALFYRCSVLQVLYFTGAILIVYIFWCAGNLRVPVKEATVCTSNIISLITNIECR